MPVRVAFIILALFTTIVPARAQGAHTLQGRVVLPNGTQPPHPVKITLTFNGRNIYETFTDLSGRFSFGSLGRGTYRLTAASDGQTFETTSVEAEVSAFGSAPQVFTQNIQLRPKAGAAVPPAGVVSVEEFDAAAPAKAKELYQKGVKRARDNKPEQAVKHFQEALAEHPQYYAARVALAEQCAKLQRYEESETAYKEAINLKSDRADAYVGLGLIFAKQKKYQEAIAPLRRSLEMDKSSATPYLFLGLSEMMTGDYPAAEASLLRAYEIGKPTIAHIYLANLYDLKGEPAKAIERLRAFLRENPESPQATQIREVIEKLRKQMDKKN